MAIFASHMGDPHGHPQTSPQHADPHGFLVWFSLKRHQIHVDRRVWAGLRVAMWIAHVGDKYRHGLLEKSLIDLLFLVCVFFFNGKENHQKKTRIFYPCRTPKSLRKKGKALKKARSSLNIKKKARKFKKSKEKKMRDLIRIQTRTPLSRHPAL